MDKRQRLVLAILGGILAAALILLAVLLLTRSPDSIISDFHAPPFEENALVGVPKDILERADYRQVDVEGNYTFSICGAPEYKDGRLFPYFASHGNNEVWLLLKVYDINGTELGTSGLLRPGECVKGITLKTAPVGGSVKVKILSYEPETYFSRGSASATLSLAPSP